MNKKFFKCKRLVICAQEPANLQKTLTMLIEERYKDEDTGSNDVNSLPKTELDSMSKRKLTTKFEEEPQKIISIFRLTPSVFQAIRRPISPHACIHEPEYAGL